MMEKNKPWYQSKTKWAGVLTAVGLALPSIIGWLNGGDFSQIIGEVYKSIIALLAVFGIRDAL